MRSRMSRRRLAARARRLTVCRLLVEPLEERTMLATFTVTNTSDDGTGSLRQAIVDANGMLNSPPGLPDKIEFRIAGAGSHSIAPRSALPTLTDPVIIDGTSQPGFAGRPLIELSGANAGAGASGLTLTGGRSTIVGLVINEFLRSQFGYGGHGIVITGSGGNRIVGCYVGTDLTGTISRGNAADGIFLDGFAKNNTIGGMTAGDGNVISGNGDDGVQIQGIDTTGNLVIGNFIGTDRTGSVAARVETVEMSAAQSAHACPAW